MARNTTPAPASKEVITDAAAIGQTMDAANQLAVMSIEANASAVAMAQQIGYQGAVAVGALEDEIRFYDALANNESAVRQLTDETLKKIAHELTENLRQNLTVDWSERESVRAKLRLMVKRVLRKYK